MPTMLFFIPAKMDLHAQRQLKLAPGARAGGVSCAHGGFTAALSHRNERERCDSGVPARRTLECDARHNARHDARRDTRYGARWHALCRACETHVRIHLPSTRTSHVPHAPFLHWYLIYWPDCAATCQVASGGVSARWA
eukprot:scaffold74117_cov61-Phaeocystis_antarctica.AAC.7